MDSNRRRETDGLPRRSLLRGIAGGGLATLGYSTISTASAQQAPIIPDDVLGGSMGNGGDDCDIIVGPSGEWDHTTISAALAAASDGAIICVLPGVYEESIAVDDKDIVLWGASNPTNIVIRGSGTVVDVNADGFIMGKCTIDARDGTGVDAADGTVLRNSRIETEGTTGVDAADIGTLGLIGVDFQDVAPHPEDPPAIDDPTGVAVHARRVRGDDQDVEGEVEDDGVVFKNCTFDGYTHGAYLVDCYRVLIRKNSFTNNLYQGLRLQTSPSGSAGFVFYDRNEFKDNFAGTILVEGGEWDADKDATISSVYARGNVFDNSRYGIFTAIGFVTVFPDDDGSGGDGGNGFPILDELLGGGGSGGNGGGDTSDDSDGVRWIVPGPLSGEDAVIAPCNYWGHPSGPQRNDNPLSNRNQFTKQALDTGDRVTEGVDVRPWAVQPFEPGEELLCHGGRVSGQF